MKVAFLHHNPGGYIGGAELTMQEFAAAAPGAVCTGCHRTGDSERDLLVQGCEGHPEEIEVVQADNEVPDADRYVIGNWNKERPSGFRYLHDMRGGIQDGDKLIFCSPLQRSRYGYEGHPIPPALDVKTFRPNRQTRRNGNRSGAVSIGAWRNPGKGQELLSEWADQHERVTVYGDGDFIPQGPNLDYQGPLEPHQVPEVLWGAERFVHLPTAVEPFGRAVAEAHIAGCDVITNKMVGARYWISEAPEKIESAAEDFWELVLNG